MRKICIYFFALIFSFLSTYAQQLKIISAQDKKPLANVLVFDRRNNLITISNGDGIIERKDLKESEQYYLLNYETVITDTLKLKDIQTDTINLDTKIISLKEVVISNNNKRPDYIAIRGYFNNLITNNKRTTGYIEGIIEYYFDYKNGDYKTKKLLEYRVFEVVKKRLIKKEVSTLDIDNYKLPELKNLGKYERYKNNSKYILREKLDNENNKEIQILINKIKSGTIKLFGYAITNYYEKFIFTYNNGVEDIDNFQYFKSFASYDLKHKSEIEYNTIQEIHSFYTSSISYLSKKEMKKVIDVNLNKKCSNYQTPFWNFTSLYQNVKNKSPLPFIEGLLEKENIQKIN